MIHEYRVHLDSRDRVIGSTIYQPSFHLSKTLHHVISYEVKTTSFANTLDNVRQLSNSIVFSTDQGQTWRTETLEHGFYTPEEIVTWLNSGIFTASNSVNNLQVVTFNVDTNTVDWGLSEMLNMSLWIDCSKTSMIHVLGLPNVGIIKENFKSSMFLASPMHIGFFCKEIHSTTNIHAGTHQNILKTNRQQPFHISPILAGHNEMSIEKDSSFVVSLHTNTHIQNMLSFSVLDMHTHELCTDMNNFSMTIIFKCKY
jgi:hypothetical protein